MTPAATTATDAQDTAERGPEADAPRPMVSIRAIVRADDVHLATAVVGGAIGERVEVVRGLVRHAYGGRSLEIRQGGAGVVATAGGASLDQAGAQAIISAGSVTIHRAGSVMAVARDVEVERGGLVVLGLSPRMVVHDGGRVLLGPLAALALAGGLALAGIALGMARRARSRGT